MWALLSAYSEIKCVTFWKAVAAVINWRLLELQDPSFVLFCGYIIIAVLLDKALLKRHIQCLGPAAEPRGKTVLYPLPHLDSWRQGAKVWIYSPTSCSCFMAGFEHFTHGCLLGKYFPDLHVYNIDTWSRRTFFFDWDMKCS